MFTINKNLAEVGLPFAVYEQGHSSHDLILIINAFGVRREFWNYFAGHFSRTHKCVIWDLHMPQESGPGGANMADVSLDKHLNDIDAILELYVHHQNVHLIGWCTGAELAVQYWLHSRHKRIRSMALLNGAYRFPDQKKTTAFINNLFILVHQVVKNPAGVSLYLDFLNRNMASQAQMLNASNAHIQELVNLALESEENLLRYSHLLNDFNAWPTAAYDDVNVPSLLITGDLDGLVADELTVCAAAKNPQFDLLHLSNQDHYLLYHNQQVWDAIHAHMRSHTAHC